MIDNANQKIIINRLNRAEGQIRALRRMVEESKKQDCKKFITQVKAARSALKGVSEQYVLTHIHTCQTLPQAQREEHIEEAIKILASD
jgi:DNA-binding FrmR family transcriptional regulator